MFHHYTGIIIYNKLRQNIMNDSDPALPFFFFA